AVTHLEPAEVETEVERRGQSAVAERRDERTEAGGTERVGAGIRGTVERPARRCERELEERERDRHPRGRQEREAERAARASGDTPGLARQTLCCDGRRTGAQCEGGRGRNRVTGNHSHGLLLK